MKTVFSSHQELCHIWASGSQEHGRATNMSFGGDSLNSYATTIATRIRHKGKTAYLVDTASFSSSTSKHQGRARHAIPSGELTFYVNMGHWGQSLKFTPETLRDYYISEFTQDGEKSRYAHVRARDFCARFESLEKAIEVCSFFKIGGAKAKALFVKYAAEYGDQKLLVEAHDKKCAEAREYRWSHRAEIRQKQAENTIKRIKTKPESFSDHRLSDLLRGYDSPCSDNPELRVLIEAEMMHRSQEKIAKWRGGEYVNLPYGIPVMLRVTKDGRIETSRCAVIPYESGERCFRFAIALKAKGWHRNGEKFAVGPYQLDEINAFGIKAGCHDIPWDEIESFAKAQGWTKG